MNRRKRGNKRYKTERAFLVRFSTISILIGLIQFSHFFYRARSFALSLQFECKGIVYGVSAMLAENLPQLCAVCMATEPLCCWLEICFIFLLLFFGSFVSTSPEWRMHIYIYISFWACQSPPGRSLFALDFLVLNTLLPFLLLVARQSQNS